MTDNTKPEALRLAAWLNEGAWHQMRLGDVEAAGRELRRQHTRIAELESELEAVGAGGVQALSAAPADVEDAIAWLVTWKGGEHTYVHAHASELPAVTQARVMGGAVTPCVAALAASPTPTAEQPIGEVVVTKDEDGQIVAVTRQDDEGRILSVIATSDPAKQQTHPGAVYAELHEPDATTVGLGAVWNRHSMRDFADRTHALRMQAATKAAPGEPSDVEIDDFLDSPACITWVIASNRDRYRLLVRAVLAKWAAPQQEAQEPCPTCAALARTVMLDQVSFDRKPDCYGIRQITDDEGVEEWEDIRTSPDVAREEANDMMATGRGEIYEVVPLWTTPQPALDCHHRPPCDECAALAAQGGKDA